MVAFEEEGSTLSFEFQLLWNLHDLCEVAFLPHTFIIEKTLDSHTRGTRTLKRSSTYPTALFVPSPVIFQLATRNPQSSQTNPSKSMHDEH